MKFPNTSNTSPRERGCGQLRDFTQCGIVIFYKHFAFFLLVSSGSCHCICLREQRNEHHIWQDEALLLVAAFQKHYIINNCRERSITRQCLAVPNPALNLPDDNGQSLSGHADERTTSSAGGWLELGIAPESFLERRTRKMMRRRRRKRIIMIRRRSLAR